MTDIVSPAIAGDVDCEVTFPYILVAGGTLNCTYSADLPDASDRTNTATATLQNHSYAFNKTTPVIEDPFGHHRFLWYSQRRVSPTRVVTEIDECIDVSDTNVGRAP